MRLIGDNQLKMSGKCYFLLFELKWLYFNDSINWVTAQNKCLSGRMALTLLEGVNVKTSLPELTLCGKRVDLIKNLLCRNKWNHYFSDLVQQIKLTGVTVIRMRYPIIAAAVIWMVSLCLTDLAPAPILKDAEGTVAKSWYTTYLEGLEEERLAKIKGRLPRTTTVLVLCITCSNV